MERMPTVGYIRKDRLGGYMAPPIKHADGNYYLKIGRGSNSDPRLTTLEELQAWFKSEGDSEQAKSMERILKLFIPLLKDSPVQRDTCVVTKTKTGYPYIDMIDGTNLGVVVACNGVAAKSSDEWGRVAALMLANKDWVYDIPSELFKAIYAK